MITQLHIKNFTIVEQLLIDFANNMTALTGETGAGKSIIIDTIELVLGARTDNKIIRPGTERCEISAVFDLKNNSNAKKWLQEQEIDDENDECIIRRAINIDGKSRTTINGTPVPQQLARELGEQLINIHGQHEYQTILKKTKQREILDSFAGHNKLCQTVADLYNNWQKLNTEKERLEKLCQNQDEEKNLLNYQIQELTELSLQENELEELHAKHKQLINAEELLHNCTQATELLNNHNLTYAQNLLLKFNDLSPEIASTSELINSAIINISEAEQTLNEYLDRVDLNPQHLQQVETRLNKIYDLARKHRIQPERLFSHHNELKQKLAEQITANEKLTQIKKELQQIISNYQTASNQLTQSRKLAANELATKITAELKRLNMEHSRFTPAITALEKFTPYGQDEIEFLISTNPGQPLEPLAKIASGGELSRVSLAIQVITAKKEMLPTLIFDEVDAGIGGKTAQVVGTLLRTLGEKTQVLTITHLPQVAAQSHHQLLVEKKVQNQKTFLQITNLNHEQRIQEIARMQGGAKITEQTLAHAREMLELGSRI